jgi:hypothetical protein
MVALRERRHIGQTVPVSVLTHLAGEPARLRPQTPVRRHPR